MKTEQVKRISEAAVTRFEESKKLSQRAHKVIPAGAHTYSRGDDQFPQNAPGFLVRGQGSHVWDVDGNEYVDWSMGLRSVILGHAYPRVLDSVREYLPLGTGFARPHPIEVEFAELMTQVIPSAQMVKFAKNGSDVTTAAVKLARAYTGRDLIARCAEHPFFSTNDWFIGDTACNSGIPQAVRDLTKRFTYNDLASLENLFRQFSGRIACVILEPAQNEPPKNDFLQNVQKLCRREGAVLIFDEIITGFRWHPRGAQTYFGVIPDLSTFGKAIGNGFAVSALVGKAEIMELGGLKHSKERVFLLSTTHGGEIHELAAAKVTVEIIQSEPVVDHVWKMGKMLIDGLTAAAKEFSLQNHVITAGTPCSPYQLFLDEKGQVSMPLRTLFLQETIKQGVLIPYIAPSYSHSTEDIEKTVAAGRKAMQVLSAALERGSTDGLLVGSPAKPVFRKFN